MKAGNQNTIPSFLWSIIKPYKWWYLLMMQAPIIGGFYNVANMYSLKLVVDAFGGAAIVQYGDLFLPIALYIGSILLLETTWRVSQFAWMKSQPFVRADIVAQSYAYVQNHSYQFFQNTPSGSITSKIKGIATGYDNLWFSVHHRITHPFLNIVIGISALAFINFQLFIFVAIWSLVFFLVMLKMSLKVGKLSAATNDSKHEVIGLVADNITNIFSIFFLNAKKRELEKIKKFTAIDVAKKDYAQIKCDLNMALIGGVMYTKTQIYTPSQLRLFGKNLLE